MSLDVTGRFTALEFREYKCDANRVRAHLPFGFELVVYRGKAKWDVMMAWIERMRPAGLPEWCGVDFSLVSYRLPVSVPTEDGRTICGLYCVRSESTGSFIEMVGGILPGFRLDSVAEGQRLLPSGNCFQLSNPRLILPLLFTDSSDWLFSSQVSDVLPSGEFLLQAGRKEGLLGIDHSVKNQATRIALVPIIPVR